MNIYYSYNKCRFLLISFVTDHYRRFVHFDTIIGRVESVGFKIIYKVQSKGLAPYGTEDPVVIRLIAQK